MKFIPYIKVILLIAGFLAVVAGVSTYDSNAPKTVTAGLDFMFNFSVVLIALTAFAAILMPIVGIIQNPGKSVKSLVGLVIVVVVFLVAYALSSEEPILLASGKTLDNTFDLKFADTAIYATYFMFAGVLLSIVVGEVYKLFK